MPRADWLADVLRDEGLDVYEMPGWKDVGRDMLAMFGVVWHHTATGTTWLDGHVAILLRKGRTDLVGPLSQLGLERDGTFVCIAAGRCNHNGYGLWGNNSIGIEAYNDGKGEPWPQVQLDAYDAGTAAILRHLDKGANRVSGHREQDPRKPDPRGIDMDAARKRVAILLNPPPPVAPYIGDELMPAALDDLDARKALIRQWFHEYLGRGPFSVAERDLHLWVFTTKGADECLAGIVDSVESQKYRATRLGG